MLLMIRPMLLTIVPLCFTLVIIALLLGTFVPPVQSIDERLFALCELPRWAGITLNETPFSLASTILTEQLAGYEINLMDFPASFGFSASLDGQQIRGTIGETSVFRGVVDLIYLDGDITLVPMMQRLGTPGCIEIYEIPPRLVLSLRWQPAPEESYEAIIMPDENHQWGIHSSPQELYFYAHSICGFAGTRPWIGFAPIWRYQQIAPFSFTLNSP